MGSEMCIRDRSIELFEVSGHAEELSDHSRAGKHEFRESQGLERSREAAGSAYIGIKSSIPVIFFLEYL